MSYLIHFTHLKNVEEIKQELSKILDDEKFIRKIYKIYTMINDLD